MLTFPTLGEDLHYREMIKFSMLTRFTTLFTCFVNQRSCLWNVCGKFSNTVKVRFKPHVKCYKWVGSNSGINGDSKSFQKVSFYHIFEVLEGNSNETQLLILKRCDLRTKLYRIEHLKRLLNQRTNEAVTAALQAREAPKWVFFSSKVIYLTTEIDIVY